MGRDGRYIERYEAFASTGNGEILLPKSSVYSNVHIGAKVTIKGDGAQKRYRIIGERYGWWIIIPDGEATEWLTVTTAAASCLSGTER
jgi:hypothetical protein